MDPSLAAPAPSQGREMSDEDARALLAALGPEDRAAFLRALDLVLARGLRHLAEHPEDAVEDASSEVA